MEINTKTLPKIDLHHHFDGAFSVSELYKEAKRRKLKQGELSFSEFSKSCQVSPNCRSLSEFLAVFSFFYDIAKDLDFLKKSALNLVLELKQEGLIYAETRFSPHLLTPDNKKLEETVEAILSGLQEGEKQTQLKVNVILCMMRGSPEKHLQEIIELAQKYHTNGVVAIDLAGDESRFLGKEYADLFKKAHDLGIPITIHAGEGAGAESVNFAIKELKASRIGHGIRSEEDFQLMSYLKENQIPLEICLTSNVQTGTVSSYQSHPFPKFLQEGLCVTLNTDDPSVSGINLTHEWDVALKEYELSPKHVKKILENSVKGAFCNLKEKEFFFHKINEYFQN